MILIFSYSHILILSYSHILIFSSSHNNALLKGLNISWRKFSWILEKRFNVVKDLQFPMFPRSFILIGLPDAAFVSSGNEPFMRSWLIIFVRWNSITLTDSLPIFYEILSGPVAYLYLILFLIMCIGSIVAVEQSKVSLKVFEMLGWLWYFWVIVLYFIFKCLFFYLIILFSKYWSIPLFKHSLIGELLRTQVLHVKLKN